MARCVVGPCGMQFHNTCYARDGEWTEPVRVENVENCISPIVTPDQKYVIYLDGPSALVWRDTSFIEELRPE